MEKELERKRPQDDVPTEVIIHYIVRDYRRMYNMHEALMDKLYAQQAKIKNLQLRLQKAQKEAKPEGEIKTQLNNLTARAVSAETHLSQTKAEYRDLRKRYEKLKGKMAKFKQLVNSLPDDDGEVVNTEE